jgi:hypothetical protein
MRTPTNHNKPSKGGHKKGSINSPTTSASSSQSPPSVRTPSSWISSIIASLSTGIEQNRQPNSLAAISELFANSKVGIQDVIDTTETFLQFLKQLQRLNRLLVGCNVDKDDWKLYTPTFDQGSSDASTCITDRCAICESYSTDHIPNSEDTSCASDDIFLRPLKSDLSDGSKTNETAEQDNSDSSILSDEVSETDSELYTPTIYAGPPSISSEDSQQLYTESIYLGNIFDSIEINDLWDDDTESFSADNHDSSQDTIYGFICGPFATFCYAGDSDDDASSSNQVHSADEKPTEKTCNPKTFARSPRSRSLPPPSPKKSSK